MEISERFDKKAGYRPKPLKTSNNILLSELLEKVEKIIINGNILMNKVLLVH